MRDAAERVWAMVSGLPSGSRERRKLMVLQVYIDDSGTGAKPVFVLAGWLADSAAWARFSTEWKVALTEPPAIDYFKMQEAWSCADGEFRGWNVEHRNRKVSRLAGIIKDHARLGVHYVIPYEQYRLLISSSFGKRWKDPFVIGSYLFMIASLHFFKDQGIDEPIDFIFDERKYESDKVQSFYTEFVAGVPDEYKQMIGARPRHEDDKCFLPLQAADMLAWHIRRARAEPDDQKIKTSAIEIFDIEQKQLELDVNYLSEIMRS
jgi:hypothetical protein